MDVEIRVDRVLCIGSGQCVHWAPGVFEQDENAISVVVDPRGEPEERIVHAVLACPVRAITLCVGGTEVHPQDLENWVRGVQTDDPVVPLLEQLSVDHHELRAVLTAQPSAPTVAHADELCARTTGHLRDEERVYSAITALIGPDLVDSFQDDHTRIEDALAEVATHRADPVERERALRELVSAVDDHIRLEETVLFPAALAALGRRLSPAGATGAG